MQRLNVSLDSKGRAFKPQPGLQRSDADPRECRVWKPPTKEFRKEIIELR